MANHWHYQLMKHSDGTVAIHEYFPSMMAMHGPRSQ